MNLHKSDINLLTSECRWFYRYIYYRETSASKQSPAKGSRSEKYYYNRQNFYLYKAIAKCEWLDRIDYSDYESIVIYVDINGFVINNCSLLLSEVAQIVS